MNLQSQQVCLPLFFDFVSFPDLRMQLVHGQQRLCGRPVGRKILLPGRAWSPCRHLESSDPKYVHNLISSKRSSDSPVCPRRPPETTDDPHAQELHNILSTRPHEVLRLHPGCNGRARSPDSRRHNAARRESSAGEDH